VTKQGHFARLASHSVISAPLYVCVYAMDFRVELAIRFVKRDLGREFSLRQLASVVHLSPSRFRFLFKSETGLGPKAYIHLLKMEFAKHLLENTSLTLEQIMIQIGLNDRSHFERGFKKDYGLTPAQYRTASRLAAVI
jgi:AraC-like DNA-binding protein